MNSFKKLKKIVYDFDSKIKQCKILKIQISDNNFENYYQCSHISLPFFKVKKQTKKQYSVYVLCFLIISKC